MQFVPCSTNSLPDEGHRYSRHLAYHLLAIWTKFGQMSSYQNHQLQKNYMSKNYNACNTRCREENLHTHI